jgi:glutathione S-transferase
MFMIGGLRFRVITGRWTPDDAEAQRRLAGAYEALAILDRHLAARPFLVGDRYSIADIAVFAYAHVAEEAGIETAGVPNFRAWLGRVRAQPGFMDDLAPYPPNAGVLAGKSIYG